MNIIDSDSVRPIGAAPDKFDAVPGAAQAEKKVAGQSPSSLRARLAKILAASGVKAPDAADGPSHFTFGIERVDHALRGNAPADGLPRAALHELHAAEKGDITSTATMALLLAERCRKTGQNSKPVLWISESREAHRQGHLYPPGLAELGIDPASIIHVDAPDSIAALRVAADGVRSCAMGAVIAELTGRRPKGLDMTATRRLSLSARESGVLSLLLRSGSDVTDPLPSAAFSRWQVCAAPSAPLEANAPGLAAFDLTLLRHRSGLYGLSARLEWNRDQRIFKEIQPGQQGETPDIGSVSALSTVRADHKKIRAA